MNVQLAILSSDLRANAEGGPSSGALKAANRAAANIRTAVLRARDGAIKFEPLSVERPRAEADAVETKALEEFVAAMGLALATPEALRHLLVLIESVIPASRRSDISIELTNSETGKFAKIEGSSLSRDQIDKLLEMTRSELEAE